MLLIMEEIKDVKQVVKDKYNEIARMNKSCCNDDCGISNVGESYTTVDGYVSDADLGLGCGLPTEHAGIRPGNVVVDLGSGAGNDAFIARTLVGEEGRVIGIDMAEDMLHKANANLEKLGFTNVEFRHGEIEDIPLANETADVVVSNCVFNLVPDKSRAFAETFRILKPGGHFSISDIVVSGDLPQTLRQDAELYVGCVSGAIERDAYLEVIRQAGFASIAIAKEHEVLLSDDLLDQHLSVEEKKAFRQSATGIYSITVNAVKPDDACCGSGCC